MGNNEEIESILRENKEKKEELFNMTIGLEYDQRIEDKKKEKELLNNKKILNLIKIRKINKEIKIIKKEKDVMLENIKNYASVFFVKLERSSIEIDPLREKFESYNLNKKQLEYFYEFINDLRENKSYLKIDELIRSIRESKKLFDERDHEVEEDYLENMFYDHYNLSFSNFSGLENLSEIEELDSSLTVLEGEWEINDAIEYLEKLPSISPLFIMAVLAGVEYHCILLKKGCFNKKKEKCDKIEYTKKELNKMDELYMPN